MKLNVQENLKSLEMYFCDVLGYRSYTEPNNRENPYYDKLLDSEFLVLESPSVMHMLKYMRQDNVLFPLQDVIDGKIPIPECAYMYYGTHPETPHRPPHILVSTNHKIYTDRGIKIVYWSQVCGSGGTIIDHSLDYFLYCYDRRHHYFQDIPQETVDKIEDYLRSRGREIYDCM